MFAGHKAAKRQQEQLDAIDLSQLLRTPGHVKLLPALAQFGLGAELTAFCHDAEIGLLAVGTANGRLFVFGESAVQLSWSLGTPVRIKHLVFQQAKAILCCVDAKDTLSAWDLSNISAKDQAPERLATVSMRSSVTCIEASPLHSHLLIGGKDGSVDVFDVDRARLVASSRIHNCWLAQEELLRKSGVSYATSSRFVPMVVDVRHNPVDVNCLLIAYEHGVVLWSIAEQRITKTIDFILPPGAPGGGNTSPDDIFNERRLGITCAAWRPDGLVFAVGHDDGCISFASAEDEMPLTIRTIEREDVHKATEEDLFGSGAPRQGDREPIFKLSWVGRTQQNALAKAWSEWNGQPKPSGAPQEQKDAQIGSTLLVMGGLLPNDPTGVTALSLPAFSAPAAEKTTAKGSLSPALRSALSESLRPSHLSVFPSFAPPEDFVVIASASSQSTALFNPSAMLLLSGRDSRIPVVSSPHADRGLEAFDFDTLHAPKRLELPSALHWNGPQTAELVRVFAMPTTSYKLLCRHAELVSRVALSGGVATPKLVPGRSSKKDTAKRPRLLVSAHLDLCIRFWDASDALLDSVVDETGRLTAEFPTRLAHLDLDLKRALLSPSGQALEASRLLVTRPWELEITDFDFGVESLEVVVRFSTGDVIVSRLERVERETDEDGNLIPDLEPPQGALEQLDLGSPTAGAQRIEAGETIPLNSANDHSQHDHFVPVAASHIPPSEGRGTTALSDVGFVAVSSGSRLLIVNLRGPETMFFDSPSVSVPNKKGKGKSKPAAKESAAISSLTWTISSTNEDAEKSLRLLVTHANGSMFAYDLVNVAGEWILSDTVAHAKHDTIANSFSTFVLDRLGAELSASQTALQLALAQQVSPDEQSLEAKGAVAAIWITVSPVAISVYINITGPKCASFDGKGFTSASVVWNQGCPVLAVAAQDGSILVLSLPDLSFISKVHIPSALHSMKGRLSFADDGSLLQVVDPLTIHLHTLFDGRQPAFPPEVHIEPSHSALAAAGTALSVVSTTFTSWFGGKTVYTGAEVDAILGGPDRPPPRFRNEPLKSQVAIDAQRKAAERARERSAAAGGSAAASSGQAGSMWSGWTAGGASSMMSKRAGASTVQTREQRTQADADSTASVMARANDALAQRGEYLSSIQDSLSNFANDAARFASDTKKAAQREAAKQSLMGGVKGFFK